MGLSRKSRRNIAVFNRLKATPSQALYSAKRIPIDTKINTFIDAYRNVNQLAVSPQAEEPLNDTANSAVGEVVGDKIS
jgi:hypothetical protein